MAIQLSDNIFVGQQKPVESKYFDGLQPWADVAAVNAGILTPVRYQGLTVNIAGVEYWYKDGIADGQLVPKGSDTGYVPYTGATADVDLGTHTLSTAEVITNNISTTTGNDLNVSTGYIPNPDKGSIYFDGVLYATYMFTDVITNLQLTTMSTFTAECWIYYDNIPTTGTIFGINGQYGLTTVSSTETAWFTKNTSGDDYFYIPFTTPSAGQWHHIAICRTSIVGDFTAVFIDGVLINSSTSPTGTEIGIGGDIFEVGGDQIGGNAWNGYITNLRICDQALYSSTFTPSTKPLKAILGTKLLLSVNSSMDSLVDSSVYNNNFAYYSSLGFGPTPFADAIEKFIFDISGNLLIPNGLHTTGENILDDLTFPSGDDKMVTVDTTGKLKTAAVPSGGGARLIVPVTADITGGTASGTDYVYLVNQTSLVIVTLPPASGNTNSYTIKKIGTGQVNIATTGGTIDGSASPITINVQYVSVTLVSDGTDWFII